MKERNLDVLGLCETRREGTGNMTIHNNYKMVWSGLPQDKRHGVAIVMTEEIAEGITGIDYVNERILKTRSLTAAHRPVSGVGGRDGGATCGTFHHHSSSSSGC